MNAGRHLHTDVLLESGQVLIVGGWGSSGGYIFALDSAEDYDSTSGTLLSTGTMTQARIDPAAARLADGRVLVVGGYGPVPNGGYDFLANARGVQPNDPNVLADRESDRSGSRRTSVTLSDGRVLVVSTRNNGSANSYDPTAGTFSLTGSLNVPRNGFTATLLSNGKVLIAGDRMCQALNFTFRPRERSR